MAPTFEAVQGDIARETTEAVVNAADPDLVAGAGVSAAIFAAAGPDLAAACAKVAPCPAGQARVTPGFALAARWIVHAVGPVWEGGDAGEPELLAATYRSALAAADSVGARSVAFPAISTGASGYPLEAAIEIAVDTLRRTPTGVHLVRFVCADKATRKAYRRAIALTEPVYEATALDPEADRESRRRARIWVWALLGLIVVAVGAVSYIGRQQETSVKKAPKAFCNAAKAYEKDIDEYGRNYNDKVGLQITRWEELAATAPQSVRADAELVLETLRAYEAAPTQKARDKLKDDPDFEAAIIEVNRRWNQGCDVFTRDSAL